MASLGTSNKAYVSAVSFLDRREIMREVSDIFNEEYYTGLSDLMSEAGRYVKSTMPDYHTFVNEALYVLGDTTGATITGSGTRTVSGVTLTAGTSGRARKGMLVIFPNSVVGIITALTTGSGQDTLTIKSVGGGNITVTAGNKLGIFAMTAGEQSTNPDNVRFSLTKYSNKIQIFKEINRISDIQAQSQVEVNFNGQPYIVYKDLIEKAMLFKSGINAAFVGGQLSDASFSDASPNVTDPGNGGAVQTTRGLNEYVTTYGISDTVASLGTWALSDQEDLISQMITNRTPKSFMAFGGTSPLIKVANHLKSLGSSATISSARLTLDGKEIDFTVEKLVYGGFTFEFMNLPILDHPALFSQTDISKSIYYVPKDKVKVHGGSGYSPRMQVRYMPHQVKGSVSGSDVIAEWNLGANSPQGPTSGELVWDHVMASYQGLECLGVQHFARTKVVS